MGLGTEMHLNDYGEYEPDFSSVNPSSINYQTEEIESLCPFLSPELNENVLAKSRFESGAKHHDKIGYHVEAYAGKVNEQSFRKNGTSGGMGTWIGSELLRLGLIDGVIHAKPVQSPNPEGPFCTYEISRTPEEIQSGAKTRYHVMEVSQVVQQVKQNEGKYLFIGVPCICKAIRRLQRVDIELDERIAFVVSLVCGHFKSVHWTLSLAWAAGVKPDELDSFQYRTKDKGIPARAYVFEASPKSGATPVRHDSATVAGGKFNAGAMMLNACNYCDDVVGETADLTIGDAWIPRFETDSLGTNCLLYTSPSPRDQRGSRMPSSA